MQESVGGFYGSQYMRWNPICFQNFENSMSNTVKGFGKIHEGHDGW